jgi:hypothetical protein
LDIKNNQSNSEIEATWSKYDFICSKNFIKKLIVCKYNESYLKVILSIKHN